MSIHRISLCAIAVAVLLVRAAAADPQPRAAHAEPPAAAPRLLDVPYVPQSEALCGGAAAAMVLRYWGAAAIHAEDFASLVETSAEGIRLGTLARAVHARGWRAMPTAGVAADVRRHLAAGRPVIALIEDRPGRHHYVVVVAWTHHQTPQIVFHDPARGPFRVMPEETFERVWAAAGRAMLLVVPEGGEDFKTSFAGHATPAVRGQPQPRAPRAAAARGTRPSPHACVEPLDEAVRLARGGDLDGAESLLSLVSETCPAFSGGPRELAGIRFVQKRWADAATFAEEAVAREPADMHAWQLVAAARFLEGDANGALGAWNRRSEPRVDLARVGGLDRTRHAVIAQLLDLPPETLLTHDHLQRAARRVAALPSAQTSRVSYSPAPNGRANVDVAVVERPLVPATWPAVAAAGLYAATAREARVDVSSPTGNGELWTMAARWWAGRPRVAVALAAPQMLGRTGLWRVDGFWERQTYRLDASTTAADGVLVERERKRAAIAFADWRSGSVRWEVGGGLDHWSDRGNQLSLGLAVERRLSGDQVAVRAESSLWSGLGSHAAFGSTGILSAWRSAVEGPAAWTGRAGFYIVSAQAPFDVWPAADTGHARAPLLRAHPLLEAGTIRASHLGRVLLHGTLEFHRPLITSPLAQFGWAAFVDAAKAGRTARRDVLQADIGIGLRARLPGAPGLLRFDLARGVGDGQVALSVAWQSAWPGW